MLPESEEEARCLLTVANASREASWVEKLLVEIRVQEAQTLLQLYQIRAIRSERQFRDAEIDVGRAHLAIRRSGYHLEPSEVDSGERGVLPVLICC